MLYLAVYQRYKCLCIHTNTNACTNTSVQVAAQTPTCELLRGLQLPLTLQGGGLGARTQHLGHVQQECDVHHLPKLGEEPPHLGPR